MKTTLLLIAGFLVYGSPRASGSQASDRDGEPAYFQTGTLTFQDRIWAQTQIERVYYNHRIWPKENPGPKPPFETMVPAALIEAKVTDSLKKSAALDKYWQHPVTGEMLQAELDRMANQTRDPATLKELFEALHNDPRLIAETLARETLSDRLIRNWYAYDTRFHAEARERAEAIAARLAAGESWSMAATDLAPRAARAGRSRAERAGEGTACAPTIEYHRQIFLLDGHPDRLEWSHTNPDELHLDAKEFAALKKKYLHTDTSTTPENFFSSSASGKELRSPLPEETPDHFILTRVLIIGDARLEIMSVVVNKSSFSAWWETTASGSSGESHVSAAMSLIGLWRLPAIRATAGCDEWVPAQNLYGGPSARGVHSAVWTGTEMVVWGGVSDTSLNSGGRYNPSTDSWRPISMGPNVPSARSGHTTVWTGSVMIVWGGGLNLNTGGRYDPVGDAWLPTNTGGNAPAGRSSHTAVWTGSLMIVWGGSVAGGPSVTGGRYDPTGDAWLPTSTGANIPVARYGHTAVWTGSEMIIWGGQIYACTPGCGYVYFNSGGRYNPTIDAWVPTSIGANAPSGRYGHTAIWSGSEMIVWGGMNYACTPLPSCGDYATATGARYNPASDSWVATPYSGLSARANHTAIWANSVMIIWGGVDNTGGRYDPSTDSWQSTFFYAPGYRNNSAIWSGTEMIVWGGSDSNGYTVNTGGRYNPTIDNWIPVSPGIPSSRWYHTAVWTGTEMIVWGGTQTGGYPVLAGGRYYPSTDSWQATSTGANVPAGRDFHTAVWTGAEMIIWGGRLSGGGGTNYTNSGGRYNPSSNTWIQTDLTTAPIPRIRPTAVWSGNEMIVWGGNSFVSGDLNSGGRYRPAANSWQPTSAGANVPAARVDHTAIWTGSEMIVWGGSNNSSTFNNGGRYNPSSDSWQPTSTGVNAPSQRGGYTAVWTGSEMIIWGGYDYDYENNGGRYNPSSNSWLPTTNDVNTPSGRSSHTAIWTGLEMIVWGGRVPNNSLAGGRYNPSTDSWLTTSTGLYTPSGRYNHTAIWSGTYMIVWGGYDTEVLGSGGEYASGSVPGPGNTLRGGKTSYINLNWSYIFGAASYNVKRCNPASTGCLPGTIVSTPTINQYSEPEDGVSHFYAVEAVNQCGATP